jgi:hypothetical protein
MMLAANNNSNDLLMRAILSRDPHEVIDSWRRWQAGSDWNTISYQVFMIIPFLYKNLEGKVVDTDLAKYRGAYRYAWYKNNMLFNAIKPVLSRLNEANLDPVLLKGAALAMRYYPTSYLRPVTDADIWIPRDRILEAVDILESQGWKLSGTLSRNQALKASHAAVFTNAAGFQIDLHWRFVWCASDVANDHFRKETVSALWQGLVVRMFRPESMFLHVCVHGARSGEYFDGNVHSLPRTLQWIIDCAQILSDDKQDFDWNVTIEQSLALNANLQLRYALARLAQHKEIKIPLHAFERLDSLSLSAHAKAHYILTVGRGGGDHLARQRRRWCARLLDTFMNDHKR